MEPVIPLAGLQPIYSVADVNRAAGDSTARTNEGLKGWYDRMRMLGGNRYIIKPSTHSAVDELYDASPNFRAVIDDLKKSLALAISGNEAVQFTPILLLGEPGLGKTHFARKLAHALGTGFEFVSLSSLTAGWVLSGASAQWHNSRPGKIAVTGFLTRGRMGSFADAIALAAVTGGPDIGQAFAALPFDHLIYTGSTSVGRRVLAAAAE